MPGGGLYKHSNLERAERGRTYSLYIHRADADGGSREKEKNASLAT
jgi:hypothetical protein